jgi:hypothetical protein
MRSHITSRPRRTTALFLFVFGLAAFALLAAQSKILRPRAAAAQEPLGWTHGYSLILLEDAGIHSVNDAVRVIRAAGGTVAVCGTSRALLGWVPPDKAGTLLIDHGIASIHYAPVDPELVPESDEGRAFVRFFNSVAGGETELAALAPRPQGPPLVEDALEHPFVDPVAVTKNLEPLRIPWDAEAVRAAENEGIFPGYSDTLEGSIAVGLLFVESNGTIDSNLYTWTDSARDEVIAQVLSGATWWSNMARTYGRTATFNVKSYSPTLSAMQQGYEPILWPSSSDGLWINAVMANMGYASGTKAERVTAFNAWLKSSAGTQWAYTAVFCYNPSGAPTRFTNNYFAYAYLGGPYTQLLYRNNGWAVSDIWKVFAHESGHIFWACDEYYQEGYGGCTSCNPCNSFRPKPNNNCEHPSCNPINAVPCMMRSNSNALCPYSAAQIGWDVVSQTLVIQAGAGGTTYPVPGSYTYNTGTSVTVTASPYATYIFNGWTGSETSVANPLTFVVNRDMTITANFRLIEPPANLVGEKVLNRSLSQAEYINVLTWEANAKNAGLNVVGYRIYQVIDGTRTLVKELDASQLYYRHRKIDGAASYAYEVAALLDTLREGKAASVAIE